MNVRKLRAATVEAGYTQVSLAKAMGMSKNTVNAMLNGRRKMYVDEACKICSLLNITSDEKKVEIFLNE